MQNPGYVSDTSDEEYEDDQNRESSDEEEDSIDVTETVGSSFISDDYEETEAELKPKQKKWDLFQTFPEKRNQEAINEYWNKVNVCIKIFLCIIFFLIVLATSLITKLTFIIIAYNINIPSNNLDFEFLKPKLRIKDKTMETDIRWIWSLVLIIIAPYIFNLAKCLHTQCFKKAKKMKWKYLPFTLIIETIHSIGLGIFVYIASSSGDALYTLYMMQGVSLVPAILKCLPSYRAGKSTSGTSMIVACLSAIIHGGFLVIIGVKSTSEASNSQWLFPVALLLISVHWWENFVPRTGEKKSKYQGSLERIANKIRHTKLEFCGMLFKLIITFLVPIVIFAPRNCGKTLFLQSEKDRSDCSLFGNVTLVNKPEGYTITYVPLILAGVNILSSVIGFKVAKTACVIRSQIACFTIPLILVTPLSFVIILLSYKQHFIQSILPHHVAWPVLRESASWIDFLNVYSTNLYLPIMFVEFINLLITVDYLWKPGTEKTASTAMLFVKPLYCGILFDQSLMLNRSSDDDIDRKKQDHLKKELQENTMGNSFSRTTSSHKEKVIPKIYACATLWRENEKEMTQLLKSIFRMDLDQFDKSFAKRISDGPKPHTYEFEAHIFFDDAFKEDSKKYTVNRYVLQLLKVIEMASRAVYIDSVELSKPNKYLTPYGGRFEWTMPGDNLLVVHFKDKKKIRVKKRWSQVMYMYYLLSYRIIDNNTIPKHKKFSTASNTFILALDGDIDFYPDAVHLLLDRMRKDGQLGAAAGRIHPKGSGPMVWYQKFEYSVGHWLQKATEHKLGCVLCSPGCFSLFRGSALLQHNVINKYATIPRQAHHYIQFDMGEDRWLCTLLLQAGKRIEYCAAADASTFCPEGFTEFYNQRRRWTPSTMANIIDLLSSGNSLRNNNPNISVLYIMYQVFLFVSSILTPGTIFLLILGAFNTAYPTVPLYVALILNLLPVVVFIILCYSATENIQLGYAAVMSTIYSLVMMIVIVGLIKQIVESEFCSVTAIFFLGVVGIFVISAMFHPREILNIFHGFMYFLTIPSSSMLLIIYALGNLNNGSWGTRVDTTVPARTEIPDEMMNDTNATKTKPKLGALSPDTLFETIRTKFSSDYVFSFGNLFRCLCCPTGQVKEEDVKMKAILEKLESVEDQLDDLKNVVRGKSRSVQEDEWNNLPYLAPDKGTQAFSAATSSFHPAKIHLGISFFVLLFKKMNS
ncbi:hypothetical protein LOTGIDRAFT_208748 [Lottia gigantea]|uniref:chitin synthase n=1 Tax=Lottia gigantea TaxID=225164 RepID=V4AUU2_LOTGI|nr:hypothetical protein LOTGIDRAFT_208748 [Lottia gigantea]ESO97576.1 hypothetical protein LOTGIDRAFT_208748 [Lottia gigantea]